MSNDNLRRLGASNQLLSALGIYASYIREYSCIFCDFRFTFYDS